MSGTRLTIADLPAKYQAQIAEQLSAGKPLGVARAKQVADTAVELSAPGTGTRLRQRSGPSLNKTELAFFDYIRGLLPDARVYTQSWTLQIANGCRYTPDFMTVSAAPQSRNGIGGHVLTAYEVKGHQFWDDARVKIKVAASMYPSIRFVLVWRAKGSLSAWSEQEVLP